jgi:NAD(P)-dependent dehydrogenase (short-subunit alcohol dehydrogenase family)
MTGYAAAEAALESQAHVYIGSSSSDRVQGAVSKLKDTISGQSIGSAQGRAIDLTSDASVKEFIDWVSNDTEGGKEKGVDHTIFTAGDSLKLGDLLETDIDDVKGVSQARYLVRGCVY